MLEEHIGKAFVTKQGSYSKYNSDIIAFMETRVNSNRARNIVDRIGQIF